MQISEIFQKFGRPEKVARVAELAAMIVARSIVAKAEQAPGIRLGDPATLKKVYAEHIPAGNAAAIAELLVKRAESLHKLAEASCNYGLSPAQEKRSDKLEAEVQEIATAIGMRAECNGDPRGAVVRLYDLKNETLGDGWGGGWAVYR